MKKVLALLFMFTILVIGVVGCGGPEEKNSPADYIDRIELFGVEDGTAYYEVYLTSDVPWSDNQEWQEELVAIAIVQSLDRPDAKDSDSFNVMGFQKDGNAIFSWNGDSEYGGKVLYYCEDGRFDRDDWILPDRLKDAQETLTHTP